MRVSNSEIQAFKRCRRKWWLGHVRRLRLRRQDVQRPRDVGNLVHNVLDTYYGAGMNALAAEARFAELATEMRETFPGDEDVQWVVDTSRIMLEGYLEWVTETGIDVGLEVVAPEAQLEVALPGYESKLVGKLDLRVHDHTTDRSGFLENKTVGNFADREKTADIDEQLMMYHLLELLADVDSPPETATSLVFLNMIRRTKRTRQAKPPFFKRITVHHNLGEMRSFYVRVLAEVRDIEAARRRLEFGDPPLSVVYPSPNKNCSWDCDFRRVCPMFDDPDQDAEGYLAAYYEEHDPYERYVT